MNRIFMTFVICCNIFFTMCDGITNDPYIPPQQQQDPCNKDQKCTQAYYWLCGGYICNGINNPPQQYQGWVCANSKGDYCLGTNPAKDKSNVPISSTEYGDPNYGVTPGNLIYDGNSNTGGTVPVDETNYTPGQIAIVKGNTEDLVKTGYSFTGWNTSSNGWGTFYAPGDEIEFTYTTSITHLYADWIKNTRDALDKERATGLPQLPVFKNCGICVPKSSKEVTDADAEPEKIQVCVPGGIGRYKTSGCWYHVPFGGDHCNPLCEAGGICYTFYQLPDVCTWENQPLYGSK